MRRTHAAALLLLVVSAGCATGPATAPRSATGPAPFSLARPGETLSSWLPYRLMRLKKVTEYALVDYDGTTVMKAIECLGLGAAARGVGGPSIDALAAFEGERDQLPPDEQMNYDLALAITGNKLPYATLMYVWDKRLPDGTVITHPMTSRVKMVVAGSDKRQVGVWHDERYNVLADYRRAFGEEAPRVASVGIMSDSGNTGSSVTAYFGDIRFVSR